MNKKIKDINETYSLSIQSKIDKRKRKIFASLMANINIPVFDEKIAVINYNLLSISGDLDGFDKNEWNKKEEEFVDAIIYMYNEDDNFRLLIIRQFEKVINAK